jgi:hypothetical protein
MIRWTDDPISLSLFAGCGRAGGVGSDGIGSRPGIRVEQVFVGIIRSQAELDEGAGIGRNFGLPAVVSLVAGHGFLGASVPDAAGLASEVMFADQGGLDLTGAFRLDALLPVLLPGTPAVPDVAAMRSRAGLARGGRFFGRLGRANARAKNQYRTDYKQLPEVETQNQHLTQMNAVGPIMS